MKKITILSIMLAFVFSASAQFIQAPKGHMTKVSETHLKTLPLNQLKQNKSVFEGWIFPADLGTNLNGGDDSFYDTYSQPIWPDSTVVTVSSDGANYVWMHSIGYVFDARSLALDENLAEAPVAGSYNVDSLVLYAWYELRNNKYDTLLIEIGAVNEDDANSLSALALGDSSIYALKTTNNATQQFGLGTVWSNPNKTTFKYTLTQNDTTFAYAKEIIIPLPSDITVGMGQVLGVNITFIPGTQYAIGDTLIIYGEDATTPNKLNSFLFYYMAAQEAFGAAFYDPFGNNAFNYNHTYSRYQTWTNPVLNAGLYPEIWGATLMAFKVSETQSIKKYGDLKVNAYPNPANDILNVELNSNENAVISIVNLIGQTVKVINTNNTFNTIQISDLTSGMYMLKVEQAGKTYTSKVVVK